ncbi:DNA damage-binding protein 1 [Xylona heveae TC161]|uniref:DNA damage-binding protein 1 n=1 Tax=Xylona heveae (strain CBS 132557 / TC161) TaxID=1328760 RepID=A0A165H9Q7_XYLHT|nr:DNA damage-binding protein 1 [Xylona heveae TC161]KZF23183.1 DNA damage-binding protein 1 [Xylona heveae TC161]
MAYLAPIHRPSSVRHALKLRFLEPDEECLVVAKANRLEIYEQTQDGLNLKHSKAIYGKVTMLHKIRPLSSPTDHLFVGTDRYVYFTVSWDPTSKQLRTEKSYVDQADKTARDSQTGDRCLIEPEGKFMTLELFEGIVTVVPIIQKSRRKDVEIGSLGEPVPARIPELFVRASAFMHPREGRAVKPKIAFLYEDTQRRVHIKVRELDYTGGGSGESGSVDLNDADSPSEELEPGASHIIPLSEPTCGLLVLGETSITYIDESGKQSMTYPLEEATIFVTWTQIDVQRFLLADDYGKLYLLMILLDGKDNMTGWKLDVIGETSRASVLVYLDAGYVFVGSHQGDSQVVKIEEGSIEVVQTFPNIAPILDFTIMDMGSRAGDSQMNEYSSGQARLVTGSGAFKDGSLRSVRSGVGLEDVGILGEMEHITELFSLKSSANGYVDTLIASFVDQTRVFQFGADGEVEEVDEHKGLLLSEQTILSANVPNERIIQVTRSSVRLLDLESSMLVAEWAPQTGQSITAASANDQVVLLSVGGVSLVALDVLGELAIKAQRNFEGSSQISCLTVPSIASDICIVGFWQNTTISVLRLDTLESLHTEVVGDQAAAVPRSVLLTQLLPDQSPTLLTAMADGTIVTFSFDLKNYSLSSRKSIIVGTQQSDFRALARGDGLYNVFATCEHPTLIYGSEGRTVFSAVTAEDASAVCPFDSQAFPGSIAIATASDLRIAVVDTERTTHVQTLPVHETVRRVAYSTKLKAFGLGTIDRKLEDGAELVQSHFKLADEVMFKELDTFALNQDELVESAIRAELPDGNGDYTERFIVGTAYLDDDRDESVRGRILVFEVTEERTLKVVTELAVKGACRALAIVDDHIVAALIKTVVVYAFEYESSHPNLVKKASYRTSTAPIDVAVTDHHIAIADLMKSVSIVEFKRGENGLLDKLEEVARHFQTSWATAVAHITDDTFLESDAEGNLLVLHRNVNGVTVEDRRRLEITSEIQLGEMVNRIRRINVPTSSSASVVPRAFLATVEGSIYLFALIESSKQDLLMRLQTNMADLVQTPGFVPFNRYRAFRNAVREADEPFRFVDGELIERFLDCPADLQATIVEGLDLDVEDIKSVVEGLRRLH